METIYAAARSNGQPARRTLMESRRAWNLGPLPSARRTDRFADLEILDFATGFHCGNQPAWPLAATGPCLGRDLGIAILWEDLGISASCLAACAKRPRFIRAFN